MFQYECPECANKVKLPQAADPGKKIRCPVCQAAFSPRAEVLAFKDEPPAKAAKPAKAAAKAVATKAAPAKAAPVAPARPLVVDDADKFDDNTPYGVIKESEEEKRLAEKNKPNFTAVRDKFKKSARGPASAILVLPTNLLIAEGSLTAIAGIGAVIVGMWPLIFTDAPPSDEEIAEQLVVIFAGLVGLLWGSLVCLGASRMQNLESYSWAMIGAVMGIFPLLAGIFSIITLRDPRVIAGFQEMEGAIDDDPDAMEEDEEDEDDDE